MGRAVVLGDSAESVAASGSNDLGRVREQGSRCGEGRGGWRERARERK